MRLRIAAWLLALVAFAAGMAPPAPGPSRELLNVLREDDAQGLHELLEAGLPLEAIFSADRVTLLQETAVSNARRCGHLLRERGAKVDAWSAAAFGWDDDLVRAIEGDPDSLLRQIRGDAPIHAAAARGHISAVTLLLDRGVSPDLEDVEKMTPLHNAAARGSVEGVRLLLERGASVNKTSLRGTPLHRAIGSPEVTRVLLEAGADVHIATQTGSTPLEHAASWGNAEVVKLLASHVKDQEVLDRALYDAAMGSEDDSASRIAQVLMAAGADVHSRHPATPLHRAASAGFPKLCRALLEAGADVNAVGPTGRTPLHNAVSSGNRATVRLLLEHGADRNARDDSGRRPFGW